MKEGDKFAWIGLISAILGIACMLIFVYVHFGGEAFLFALGASLAMLGLLFCGVARELYNEDKSKK